MQQGGAGGQLPHQILADQKAPPNSGGAPHYYSPPQIFRPRNMPVLMHLVKISIFSINNVTIRPTKSVNRADKNWAHF